MRTYPSVLIGYVQILPRVRYYEMTDRFVLPIKYIWPLSGEFTFHVFTFNMQPIPAVRHSASLASMGPSQPKGLQTAPNPLR